MSRHDERQPQAPFTCHRMDLAHYQRRREERTGRGLVALMVLCAVTAAVVTVAWLFGRYL